MLKELKTEICQLVEHWLSEKTVENPVVLLERTADQKFGEYSLNVAMRYAKELEQSPLAIAKELTAYLQSVGLTQIDRIEYVPPGFVNLYFSQTAFVQRIETILAQGTDFGRSSSHHGEKWVIEHTSPNPNKAMHLGHLRNNLVSMGLLRLLDLTGAEVTSDCIYNDRGIAIAKAMYGFLAHMKKSPDTPVEASHFVAHPTEWYTPAELEIKPDIFVTQCYVQGEEDFKSNPEIEQTVRQMVVDWEARDENIWQVWRQVLQYAYEGNQRVLDRLGSHWDKVWYEHEHYQKGKDYVQGGLERGLFQQLADGAVLSNLEADYNLPDTVLLKKDGTSLYITQDIALTDLKKRTYQADKLLWVVGPEQTMSFKQLFAVCEQLGIGQVEDFKHITYGYVGLKADGGGFQKMSSREGTAVMIDDVIDGVKNTIQERFAADDKDADEQTAETLALGAVKFAFLKSDRTQEMTFDVEQSVDVHGDSGMYVLYTYVRTQSILRKAGERSLREFTPTAGAYEHALVRCLFYYEDVIDKAVTDLSVHHIAQYLLELSSEFNSWYAKDMVLDGSVSEEYKLAITTAVGITLQNGLSILGIETVAKM